MQAMMSSKLAVDCNTFLDTLLLFFVAQIESYYAALADLTRYYVAILLHQAPKFWYYRCAIKQDIQYLLFVEYLLSIRYCMKHHTVSGLCIFMRQEVNK